jgi:hypothetical protein
MSREGGPGTSAWQFKAYRGDDCSILYRPLVPAGTKFPLRKVPPRSRSQEAVMSEADLFRQYAKEHLKIETSADKELFLKVVTQLQNEGAMATDDMFAVVKAIVDCTKEISEK